MKYTNKYNIPDVFVEAILGHKHEKGDARWSITEIIRPPQMQALIERHYDEIEVDISSMLWSFLGTSVHATLANLPHQNRLSEERLQIKIMGQKISGTVDLYQEEKKIIDFKVTSVWSYIYGDRPEWAEQLNYYAYLYRSAGLHVKQLEIQAILRDHIAGKALYDKNYPPIPFVVMPIPVWSVEQQRAGLEERMIRCLSVQGYTDEQLSKLWPCTAKERWEKPTVYALKRSGRKSAIKLYDTKEEAEKAITNKDYVETRQGESKRCGIYCNARDFCHQYKFQEDILEEDK